MKSHRIRRAWIVSLAVHFCLAVIFTYITINPKYINEHDAIKISFLKVTPIPVKERIPFVETPVVIPTPTPDLRINTQVESITRRSPAVRAVQSTMQPATQSAPSGGTQFSPNHAQVANVPVSLQHRSTQAPLTTAADLPIEADSPLSAQLSSGGALTDGVGEGSGSGLGEGRGRGSFGTQVGIGQGRQNRIGLNSLINSEGAADIDESLAGISDNMTLGNDIPSLPKGTPGAIIQGRGQDIVGRLNLVRLDDPLHPNADI